MMDPSIAERVLRAAKILKVEEQEMIAILSGMGIDASGPAAPEILDAIAQSERAQFRADLQAALGRHFLAAGSGRMVGDGDKYVLLAATAAILGDEKPRSHAQMSDEELVRRYSIDCHPDVPVELNRRSKGRPFVVFQDQGAGDGSDGSIESMVDEAATTEMLRVARRHETQGSYKLGDRIVMLNRVGEFPFVRIEACPIHRGMALVNGYCEKCADTWAGVLADDRHFVAVAVAGGHVQDSHGEAQAIIARCHSRDIRKGWPADVYRDFERQKGDGTLPILTQQASRNNGGHNMIVARFI